MIALDTKVLVRFLVSDDAVQSKKAKEFIEKNIRKDTRLFLSDIVLVEAFWVLNRSYGFSKEDIVRVFRMLIAARNLEFESTDRTARALRSYETGRADFSDYVIHEIAVENGCNAVATFDKKLLKEKGFVKP
ncbi:PIN domain-containing protein [Acidobacteriota bacterium]